MRIQINAPDGQTYNIRSRSMETIGRWFLETLCEIKPEPAYPCHIQVWPTWNRDANSPDWIADSRVIGRMLPFTNHREMIKALSEQLDEAEALNGS